MHPIWLAISSTTPDKDTAVNALTEAIKIRKEVTSLFTRFRIYLAQEKF